MPRYQMGQEETSCMDSVLQRIYHYCVERKANSSPIIQIHHREIFDIILWFFIPIITFNILCFVFICDSPLSHIWFVPSGFRTPFYQVSLHCKVRVYLRLKLSSMETIMYGKCIKKWLLDFCRQKQINLIHMPFSRLFAVHNLK